MTPPSPLPNTLPTTAEAAKQAGYIVTTSGARWQFRQYERWAENEGRPVVSVVARRKYATLVFDAVFANRKGYRLTPGTEAKITALFDDAIRQHPAPTSEAFSSGPWQQHKRLPVDVACKLAEQVADLLADAGAFEQGQ